MFILLSALVLGICGGYLLGGRLHNLEDLRLASPWLVLAALAMQIAAFSPLGEALPGPLPVVLHFASYALLVWFVIANRHRVAVVVTGIGLGLNLLAIGVNGGFMPASRAALDFSGAAYDGSTHNNSALIHAGTHLPFLGDVFAVPAWMPMANVFSIGDVVIVAGVTALIAAGMRAPRRQVAEAS